MDEGVDHILNREGILKNFSISKKITSSEMKKIKATFFKNRSSGEDYSEELRDEIIKYTDSYIKKNKIPGMIIDKKRKSGESGEIDRQFSKLSIKDPKLIALYREVQSIVSQLKKINPNMTKREMVFFCMSLIGCFDINQQDFESFRREMLGDEDDDSSSWGNFDGIS